MKTVGTHVLTFLSHIILTSSGVIEDYQTLLDNLLREANFLNAEGNLKIVATLVLGNS